MAEDEEGRGKARTDEDAGGSVFYEVAAEDPSMGRSRKER